MKPLRICNKCNARYMFFHLKADCFFMQKHFEAYKAFSTRQAIDAQIKNRHSISKDVLVAFATKVIKETDNTEYPRGFLEHTRFGSAPILIFTTLSILIVIIGCRISPQSKIGENIFFILFFAFMVWGLFIQNHAWDTIFKRMMFLDAMKRYKIK